MVPKEKINSSTAMFVVKEKTSRSLTVTGLMISMIRIRLLCVNDYLWNFVSVLAL